MNTLDQPPPAPNPPPPTHPLLHATPSPCCCCRTLSLSVQALSEALQKCIAARQAADDAVEVAAAQLTANHLKQQGQLEEAVATDEVAAHKATLRARAEEEVALRASLEEAAAALAATEARREELRRQLEALEKRCEELRDVSSRRDAAGRCVKAAGRPLITHVRGLRAGQSRGQGGRGWQFQGPRLKRL